MGVDHGLPSWLAEIGLGRHEWNLEIISPYFDGADVGTLRRLLESLDPREVRLFFPEDIEGTAQVSKALFTAMEAEGRVVWSALPDVILWSGSRKAVKNAGLRRVHAKVYRLWNRDGQEVVLTGSVNLTAAAHSPARAGNLEAAFLVDISPEPGRPGWWLKPLESEPKTFAEQAPQEDDDSHEAPIDITFRFDWSRDALSYRIAGAAEDSLTICEPAGRVLFTISQPETGGYPRFYLFEAYQIAALEMFAGLTDAVGERTRIVLGERYEASGVDRAPVPEQFPGPEMGLGVTTFITELVKNPTLRQSLWPDEPGRDFRTRFRRREQRRELLSALCRLGRAYIDLYLLAIQQLGSFNLSERGFRRGYDEKPEVDLARGFAELLAAQSVENGFHAYRELTNAAAAFDTIVAVNFHEIQAAPLSGAAEIFGRALQHQAPVAGMSGGVNKRLVAQFRVPGFPFALITTDVLQEGEDLHTFCRKVIHYGISWTPSALEQRTGRVDRIGSLLQRTLEGARETPSADELIQVHYPHLTDTVEVLQVRRVLERLNRFQQLIHRLRPEATPSQSRVDVNKEILRPATDVAQLREPLESAFPIRPGWLQGLPASRTMSGLDVDSLELHFERIWEGLVSRYAVRSASGTKRSRRAVITLINGQLALNGDVAATSSARSQGFLLELRSRRPATPR